MRNQSVSPSESEFFESAAWWFLVIGASLVSFNVLCSLAYLAGQASVQ